MYTQKYGAVGQCFANRNGTGCAIMRSKTCEGVCSLHRTKKALKSSRAAAFSRLVGLPIEQQLYIADKYYQGGQPWQKAARA